MEHFQIQAWPTSPASGRVEFVGIADIIRVLDANSWSWVIDDGIKRLRLSEADSPIADWYRCGTRVATADFVTALDAPPLVRFKWGRVRGFEPGATEPAVSIDAVDDLYYEIAMPPGRHLVALIVGLPRRAIGGGMESESMLGVSWALREKSATRLQAAFRMEVEAESNHPSPDARDAMLGMTPFIDCARRIGLDPAAVLGPIAAPSADWYRETFEMFVRRTDVTLAAFGWKLVDTPDGPAYRVDDSR